MPGGRETLLVLCKFTCPLLNMLSDASIERIDAMDIV